MDVGQHLQQGTPVRLLDNVLALMPCGKPQATFMPHLVSLLQWQPGHLNFTGLEAYGGRAALTHARWFGRSFPFAPPLPFLPRPLPD